jgi:hypothetical protein
MNRSRLCNLLGIMALLTAAGAAAGQCEPELIETFQADDPFNQFGFSVAVDGDVVVVGAPRDDEAGSNAGAVYVFRLNGENWVFEQKLTAGGAEEGEQLGGSVAVGGDLIAAGAPGFDDQRGAVYVFRRVNGVWVLETKLIPPELEEEAGFGESVTLAISGEVPVVAAGAPALSGGNGLGAVYVFRNTNGEWMGEEPVTPADPKKGDYFGLAIDLSNDRLAVGAIFHDNFQGAVYLFNLNKGGWVQEAKVVSDDPFYGDGFGVDVGLDGSTLVVGAAAYDYECDCPLPGSAYVFLEDAGAWTQEAELLPSDGMDEEFGIRVALEGDVAIVGSIHDISAYIYARTPGGWDEQAKLDLPGLDHARGIDLSEERSVFGGDSGPVLLYQLCDAGCYADVDDSGDLTLFDFLAYVNLFNADDVAADCDGSDSLDLFDFLCFVNAFNAGCE